MLIPYIGTALSSATLFTKPSTPMEAWPGACSLPEKMRMNSMLAMGTYISPVALMIHNIKTK